jgi:hypothetical protein
MTPEPKVAVDAAAATANVNATSVTAAVPITMTVIFDDTRTREIELEFWREDIYKRVADTLSWLQFFTVLYIVRLMASPLRVSLTVFDIVLHFLPFLFLWFISNATVKACLQMRVADRLEKYR